MHRKFDSFQVQQTSFGLRCSVFVGSGIHREVMLSWVQLKTFVTRSGNQQNCQLSLFLKNGHDLEDSEDELNQNE